MKTRTGIVIGRDGLDFKFTRGESEVRLVPDYDDCNGVYLDHPIVKVQGPKGSRILAEIAPLFDVSFKKLCFDAPTDDVVAYLDLDSKTRDFELSKIIKWVALWGFNKSDGWLRQDAVEVACRHTKNLFFGGNND